MHISVLKTWRTSPLPTAQAPGSSHAAPRGGSSRTGREGRLVVDSIAIRQPARIDQLAQVPEGALVTVNGRAASYSYLGGADGRAVYHKQVSLGDRDTYDYKVVSR